MKDVYTTLYANFSGNYTVTSYSVVSNVTYLEATTYRTITGNVTGVELADELGVVQANGSASIAGHGFFVGSVLGGAPGHALLSWSNVVGTFGVSVTGIIHLSYGTGGLAGVVGWGSATVAFGSGTSFSGSYVLHLDLA